MTASRVPLLETYKSLITFTDFCANNHWKMLQQLVEPFPCTVIRECDAYIVRIRKLVQSLLEQRNPTFKAWQNVITKIESFL
eukprot:Gb_15260 [translate_table: standard]